MVVLRREAEDSKSPTLIAIGLTTICITQEPRDSELATLDPYACRVLYGLKRHHAAVGAADQSVRVLGLFDRTSIGLELAVEKLVKSFYDIEDELGPREAMDDAL
jgi:hypothetical protein